MRLALRSFLSFLPLLVFACGTKPPQPAETAPPAGTVVTIILQVSPALDSLEVVDVIHGPGRLRTDYPPQLKDSLPDHLIFTFREDNERILRQTSQAYPGPNRYEVPSESGVIESIEVEEADRIISLRTQYGRRLRWLDVSGQNPAGGLIRQRVDLVRRE